jgi:hypothetical protein
LRDRHLSAQRLTALRFEIDGIGRALLRLGALLAFEAEDEPPALSAPRIILAGDALTAQPCFRREPRAPKVSYPDRARA